MLEEMVTLKTCTVMFIMTKNSSTKNNESNYYLLPEKSVTDRNYRRNIFIEKVMFITAVACLRWVAGTKYWFI